MKNLEWIKEIEEKRLHVLRILQNADAHVMKIVCGHCTHKRCSNRGNYLSTFATEKMKQFCIDGTIDWFFEERKEDSSEKQECLNCPKKGSCSGCTIVDGTTGTFKNIIPEKK